MDGWTLGDLLFFSLMIFSSFCHNKYNYSFKLQISIETYIKNLAKSISLLKCSRLESRDFRKMGRFMELSVTFHIIVRLLFLHNLQGGSKVIGQFTDLMDANLLEDVTIPTNESSCERRKRSAVKRSSSEVDDCLEYRYKCPDQVRISWLQAAPFVYEASSNDNKSDEEHTANMKGIFPEVVTRAIARCCKIFAGTIPQIRFLERASNLTTLRRDLLRGKADMIIPVHNDEEKYGGSLPYIKILDSPGVILIVPHRQPIKEWKLVLNAVLGTWPVVLIALLMSSIAGVVMWVLVSITICCKKKCSAILE